MTIINHGALKPENDKMDNLYICIYIYKWLHHHHRKCIRTYPNPSTELRGAPMGVRMKIGPGAADRVQDYTDALLLNT